MILIAESYNWESAINLLFLCLMTLTVISFSYHACSCPCLFMPVHVRLCHRRGLRSASSWCTLPTSGGEMRRVKRVAVDPACDRRWPDRSMTTVFPDGSSHGCARPPAMELGPFAYHAHMDTVRGRCRTLSHEGGGGDYSES